MPLDLKAINTNLRGAIATLIGMDPTTVRPANQNGPTGNINEPFATVLITEADSEGIDEVLFADGGVAGQLSESTSGLRALIASVQFFRTGALTNAARLSGLLRSTNGNSLLMTSGLGLKRVGKATNIPQEVDTMWEERAQLEVELYVSSVELASVPTFAGVEIIIKSETTEVTREVNLDVAP